MSIPTDVQDALQRLELTLEAATLATLDQYLQTLLEANQRMNLTAVRDPGLAWHRLIVDSLTLLPFLSEMEGGASLLDVGTGGGLPGLPLAIARPDLNVALLETTGKKCDFLRQTVSDLQLDNVEVLQGRAETIAHQRQHREAYDTVVSRAVGPMPVVLELTLGFVRVGGLCLAMKGPKAEAELMASGDALAQLGAGDLDVFTSYPEDFENDLVVVRVQKAVAMDETFQPTAGTPKRQPL